MPDRSERPVGYASRTFTKMEQQYSQIEKEGLACVYEVTKFRSFLYGHHFSLITYHKPLLTLFNENRAIPTAVFVHLKRRHLMTSRLVT